MFGFDADAGKYFTYIFLLTLHALLTNSIVRYLFRNFASVFVLANVYVQVTGKCIQVCLLDSTVDGSMFRADVYLHRFHDNP